MKIINDDNFKNEISNGKVLVDFYADWCGPCRMLSPVLEEVAKQGTIEIKKINVDQNETTAREYGIMSIPTIILFNDGNEVKRNTGYLNLQQLNDFINN